MNGLKTILRSMSDMGYLGIDTGKNGGIAIINRGFQGLVQAFALPDTERDIADLLSRLKPRIDFALIERVHSFPGQGVASSFKFGMNYGFLRGLLIALEIPFGEVQPEKWQKAMECLTHGDKNISKARAQQLFPSIKVTHKTADALLIAKYCQQIKGISFWDDI
jgi:Holliday junction resolvasome RuvABC endonuclease subunit